MSSERNARLASLAAAMKLPCPVRESFLFGADHAFLAQCTASDLELQRAAKRVFQHAGVPCDATVVLWKAALPRAARVDRDGHTWFLEIDRAFQRDGHALGAILAREAARAVLATRGVAASPSPIDVELAALLLGFGPVLLAATTAPGPLRIDAVRSLHARVTASLRLSLSRTLDLPFASAGLRFQLAILWLLARVITTIGAPRPLVFARIEPHVIIRCYCARRLRVPTGSLGQTTCPSCKRRRPFDGRACRTLAA
jgi:hypothetical protein